MNDLAYANCLSLMFFASLAILCRTLFSSGFDNVRPVPTLDIVGIYQMKGKKHIVMEQCTHPLKVQSDNPPQSGRQFGEDRDLFQFSD